jgi:PAS domain S-box-containing protein
VFWDAVVGVEPPPPEGRSPSTPQRLGSVFSRRSLTSAAASDVLSRLVGTGAVVEIGNQTGSAWTDLSKVVPAPLVNLTQAAVSEYRAPDGQSRLGALALIRGTPWAVWVEFPRDIVVAPARRFLTRMLIFGLCFVVAAAALARTLSARITTPLHQLAHAAEAIAAGNYQERVDATRRDEIGRLGAAFNTMAVQVHGTQRELEERVQRRTARLEEAAGLLERHIAELNEARQELDGFFDLSLDLLCIADMDGRFKRINPAWTNTLGWSVEELMAVPYLEFVHPDDRASVMNEAAMLAAGGTTVKFETRYRCKDGSYRWLNWKATGLPDRGVIYAAARDVTQRKKNLADLEGANQELEAFSYSVSHDLRAPLRHITGFASLLQKDAGERLDEQGRRYTQTIVEAATRMGRLIDDLLAFSRMGRTNLVKKRVSLDDLVRAAQQEVTATVSDRKIVWTVHPLPEVEGDPEMLRQVMVNLLSNAVKYTATRPRAEIEVGANGRDPGEAVMFVRDNGVGFDMQYAHKLFGVFQRLHSSDEFEGTGIGLANVRRIIHRHGGRTWAEGSLDGGAAFYFSLPTGNGDSHDDRRS